MYITPSAWIRQSPNLISYMNRMYYQDLTSTMALVKIGDYNYTGPAETVGLRGVGATKKIKGQFEKNLSKLGTLLKLWATIETVPTLTLLTSKIIFWVKVGICLLMFQTWGLRQTQFCKIAPTLISRQCKQQVRLSAKRH